MSNGTRKSDGKKDEIIARVYKDRKLREKSYRERALKMFPKVCARCGREFSGKRLKELTVHHKDHNHDNNPPDGSNWELLCIYCHDNEHSRYLEQQYHEQGGQNRGIGEADDDDSLTHKPFAGLESLLKSMKEKDNK